MTDDLIQRLIDAGNEQLRGLPLLELTVEAAQVLASKDAEIAELRKHAERYRWLRERHWNDSPLCVVANPKQNVKLGTDCPSGYRLDKAIDAARLAGSH